MFFLPVCNDPKKRELSLTALQSLSQSLSVNAAVTKGLWKEFGWLYWDKAYGFFDVNIGPIFSYFYLIPNKINTPPVATVKHIRTVTLWRNPLFSSAKLLSYL